MDEEIKKIELIVGRRSVEQYVGHGWFSEV